MPPPSARTIQVALSALLGVQSIGDRGLHRSTGAENPASHPTADEGVEAVATTGIPGVRPSGRPFAPGRAAPTSIARPSASLRPS